MKNLGQMTINSKFRSETPFIMRSGYTTFNNRSPQMKTNYSSFFGPTNTKKDLLLSKYYKELFLKQVDLKLDEKVYELITKMHDAKAYSEAKEKYEEKKRILIMEILKNKNDKSQYLKNPNIVNMKNFEDSLLNKFSYYEKDNQIMYSFFNKLKTRKKKVYKYKIKKALDGLYQGNVALYRKRKKELLEQKKKPVEIKFDLSIYLRSNAEIEEYIRNFKRKKVMFDNNSNDKSNNEESNSFRRIIKRKKTFVDKTNDGKMQIYFKDLNLEQKRRASLGVTKSTSFNFTNLHSFYHPKENKQENPPLNLPNIDDKNESNSNNSNKSSQKDKKENENSKNKSDFNDNEKNKEILNDEHGNQSNLKIKENQDNKIDENENIKDENEKSDNKIESIISDKNSVNSKSSIYSNVQNKSNKLNNFIKINNLKVNNTRNKKNLYESHKNSNTSQKYKNEILSELNNEKNGLTMSASKLNKSLKIFKNTKENFNTIRKIKKSSSQNDIIPPTKKVGVVFKDLSENNSQFHFPLINKIFYKNEKGECDMIDRIKYNLKHEYSERLKQKKIDRKNSIDGKEIINRLNDQYALEKLFELSEMFKKKRRQEEQY